MAGSVSVALESFWRWWTEELKALLPRAASPGSRRGARLVVSVEGRARTLHLEEDGRIEPLAKGDGDDALASLGEAARARPGLPVGLRLGVADCFSRIVQLPAQAEADFARILELDMERTTPFRSSEVLTAFYVLPDDGVPRGKRAVRHLVVKRRTVDPVLQQMRDIGHEPAFVDCWDETKRQGLPVDFLASTRPGDKRDDAAWRRAAALLAVVLAVSAVAIPLTKHRSALATVEARTETARSEAATVRLAMEASQAAAAQIGAMERRLRGRIPVARILEELTIILPDSAWISDLRIDGDMVEFTAFAKSAAALIPALEASPLFGDATLTSPVVLDGTEDKERFSARLRLTLGEVAVVNGEAQPGTSDQ